MTVSGTSISEVNEIQSLNTIKGDNTPSFHLIASEGKVLQRISDKQIFGYEIYLGYTYYIGSQKLPEPLLELPEHYCEIDAPEEYKDMLY